MENKTTCHSSTPIDWEGFLDSRYCIIALLEKVCVEPLRKGPNTSSGFSLWARAQNLNLCFAIRCRQRACIVELGAFV